MRTQMRKIEDCSRYAQEWWRKRSLMQKIGIVFFTAFVVWIVWPFLPKLCRLDSIWPKSLVENPYLSLHALIAVVGLPLIYVSYLNSKQKQRDDEFKRIELEIVKGLYPMLRAYNDAVNAMRQCCNDKETRSGKPLATYLYDQYRVQELTLLRDIQNEPDDGKKYKLWKKLSYLDEQFKGESGCLQKPHEMISTALEWTKSQVDYMRNLYSGDGYEGYSMKIDEMKERLLEIIRSYTIAGHRFLLAKYRHHEHKMDIRNYGEDYRGFQYADYFFAYSRTLAHIGFRTEETAHKYCRQMKRNYAIEPNGIKDDKSLWVNFIHIVTENVTENVKESDMMENDEGFVYLSGEAWKKRDPLPDLSLPKGVHVWDWYSRRVQK